MNVELGAGFAHDSGFVAVDVNPASAADVIAEATRLPFRCASIEALRAVDVLEHLSYRDTDAVLAEWSRVAREGCQLFVQVPAADVIMQWFVTRPSRLLKDLPGELPRTPLAGAAWRLLGGHSDGVYVDAAGDWRWNAHYALFDAASLCAALRNSGWEVDRLVTNPFPNLQCWATRR